MAKPRTARDYEDDVTAASRSGLAELMTVLGAYRDALVLIGGWAPYLTEEYERLRTDAFMVVGEVLRRARIPGQDA